MWPVVCYYMVPIMSMLEVDIAQMVEHRAGSHMLKCPWLRHWSPNCSLCVVKRNVARFGQKLLPRQFNTLWKLNYHIPRNHQRSLLSHMTDLDMYPVEDNNTIFNLHMLKIFIILNKMQFFLFQSSRHSPCLSDLCRGHPFHLPFNYVQGGFLHSTAHEILKRSMVPREQELFQYAACITLADMQFILFL